MDPVTLYAIVKMANGAPRDAQGSSRALRAVRALFQGEAPDGGHLVPLGDRPPRPFMGDHIPRENVVEYVPDAMDMLGMPSSRWRRRW